MSCHPVIALVMLLGFSSVGVAQNKDAAGARPQEDRTVIGCLTGYEGQYTLGTANDMLYSLEGDADSFKRLNAKMVKATGTITAPPPGTSKDNVLSQQPPTMKVTSLKKVADGCN